MKKTLTFTFLITALIAGIGLFSVGTSYANQEGYIKGKVTNVDNNYLSVYDQNLLREWHFLVPEKTANMLTVGENVKISYNRSGYFPTFNFIHE